MAQLRRSVTDNRIDHNAIVLLKFLRLKNLLAILIIIGAIYVMIDQTGDNTFERTFNTVSATITFNEEAIIEADHSASFRIVPIIVLAMRV